MTARIRVATAGDAPELSRLRWEFRIEAGTPATRAAEAFEAEMRDFVRDVLAKGSAWHAWVAEEDDGRLVGCVWLQLVEKVPHPGRGRWERPVAYVTSMYVEPDRRDEGLGRALLDVAVTFARERGVDGVLLWPSERSVPFYRRAGFEPGPWLWSEMDGD
jgi:GNAT superfamily N-acetyltransferase